MKVHDHCSCISIWSRHAAVRLGGVVDHAQPHAPLPSPRFIGVRSSSAHYPGCSPRIPSPVIRFGFHICEPPRPVPYAPLIAAPPFDDFARALVCNVFAFYLLSLISNCAHKFRINFEPALEFAVCVCTSLCRTIARTARGNARANRCDSTRMTTKCGFELFSIVMFHLSLSYRRSHTHSQSPSAHSPHRSSGACAHT